MQLFEESVKVVGRQREQCQLFDLPSDARWIFERVGERAGLGIARHADFLVSEGPILGQSSELSFDLLEGWRGRVGANGSVDHPNTAASPVHEDRVDSVGVTVPLAKVPIQAAQEVAAENAVAEQGGEVTRVVAFDPPA